MNAWFHERLRADVFSDKRISGEIRDSITPPETSLGREKYEKIDDKTNKEIKRWWKKKIKEELNFVEKPLLHWQPSLTK